MFPPVHLIGITEITIIKKQREKKGEV